jgi:CHU_C Type IX secretion signal domain/SprB repeat
MRNFFPLTCIFLLLVSTTSYSQPKNGRQIHSVSGKKTVKGKKWTTNPFDNQVFIENKGQFDGILPGNEKVYFVVRLGGIQAFFTATGIVYRMKKYPPLDFSKGQDPDENGPPKPIIKYVYSEWKESNPNVQTSREEEQSFYYTYPSGADGTIKTNVFKKITYRNLYPGIDAEYSFKKGKEGIEYKLIVHPGADISKARLVYKGDAGSKITATGDIEAETKIGTFNMSSPECYYQDNNEALNVSYLLKGNEESFSVKNPDNTKTYIIDPWISNPGFTTTDNAYNLDFDYYGNVYVYGGDANPFQLIKLNSAGVVQWVFNATTLTSSTAFFGDLAVDRVNGTTYLTEGWNSGGGARVEKVNYLGILETTYAGDAHFSEMYKAAYDACNRDIIIGGGGTTYPYQACVLDTNMITETPVNVEGVSTGYHDMALLCVDPNGDTCYMGTTQSLSYIPVQNNYLVKLPLPSLSPTALDVHDGLSFHEIESVFYVTGGTDNGFNGMAASPKWLYYYNGDTIFQVNKITGTLNNRLPLNPHYADYQWGGLDVDEFDDIYIGYNDSIRVYNSSLSIKDSFALPNTVYAVRLSPNNMVFACGIGFVTADTIPPPPPLISTATGNPTSCSACNGSASVTLNAGVTPFSFLWSNGETTQTDTGLCAGIYTVIVTDASCPPRIDTAIASVAGEAGFTASVIDTNPNCALSLGNITVNASGGSTPYTYSWSTGGTTNEISGIGAGTYTCTISDSSGCKYDMEVVLVNPITPTITIAPGDDSICIGTSVPMTASGVSTYTWTPTTGLSCYTCASPTATPTTTTTYTVSGLDSIGCPATATALINVFQTPRPVISGKDSVCTGYTDTLTATGGTSYTWSDGATTSSIHIIISSPTTVTVLAKNGICTHDTTFTIKAVSLAPRIVPSKDSACSGDTVKLSATGGVSYSWSNHSTSTSIIVSPNVPTTYTLYTTFGTCKDSSTITIGIEKDINETLSTNPDSICPGSLITLKSTPTGTSPMSYSWNTGGTYDTINARPNVTTIYTVTIYGKCNSTTKTITALVVPLPASVISGTSWKCHFIKDTLTVSSSTNPTTYLWSNGSTKDTYYTGEIDADSTISLIAFNALGCSDTTSFLITSRAVPDITISKPPAACTGLPVEIIAKATGTGPFTYSWSPGGETTDSISVPSPADSTSVTYTATVTNGCPASKIIEITAEFPILNTIGTQTVNIVSDTSVLWASGNSVPPYHWQDSLETVCLDPPACDTVRVTPTITTTYTVTGKDKAGCEVTGYVTVIVEVTCLNFTVPNVFTPGYAGTTGHDNEFYIKTENLNAWSIVIFDRWGKEMYNSTNPYQYWSGTNESGSQAADGVYYYVITGVCQNTTYKKEGFVQLIR